MTADEEGEAVDVRPQRFFVDGALYAVAAATAQVAPLLLVPAYARMLTAEGIGLIALVTAVLALAAPVASLGLDSAVARFHWVVDPRERQVLLGTAFWAQVVWSTGLAAIVVMVAAGSFALLGEPASMQRWITIGAVVPLRVAASFVANWLRIRRRPLAAAAFNMFQGLSTVGATLALLLLGRGVDAAFEGQVFGLAASLAAAGVALLSIAGRPAVDRSVLRRMLAYSLPLVPAALLAWVYAYADRWVLAALGGLAETGSYQMATYVSMAVGLPVLAFGQAWGPFAFRVERHPQAAFVLGRIGSWTILGLSLLAFFLVFWGRHLLVLVAGPDYAGAALPLALLGFGQVFLVFTMMGALQCNLGNNNLPYLWALAAAGAFSLLLNLALVPLVGAVGAAAAFLLSHLLAGMLVLRWSRRVRDLQYPVGFLFQCVGAFALLAVPAWWLSTRFPGPASLLGLAALGIGLASGLGWRLHGLRPATTP